MEMLYMIVGVMLIALIIVAGIFEIACRKD